MFSWLAVVRSDLSATLRAAGLYLICAVVCVVAAVIKRFAAAGRCDSKGAYNDVSSTKTMCPWLTLTMLKVSEVGVNDSLLTGALKLLIIFSIDVVRWLNVWHMTKNLNVW